MPENFSSAVKQVSISLNGSYQNIEISKKMVPFSMIQDLW